MAAECQKDASLIKYGRHSASNIFLPVLPPIGTWIAIAIIL